MRVMEVYWGVGGWGRGHVGVLLLVEVLRGYRAATLSMGKVSLQVELVQLKVTISCAVQLPTMHRPPRAVKFRNQRMTS